MKAGAARATHLRLRVGSIIVGPPSLTIEQRLTEATYLQGALTGATTIPKAGVGPKFYCRTV